jgi:hypothetical protein
MRLCVYEGGLFSVTCFRFGPSRRTLSLPRDSETRLNLDRENGNLSRNAHTAEAM